MNLRPAHHVHTQHTCTPFMHMYTDNNNLKYFKILVFVLFLFLRGFPLAYIFINSSSAELRALCSLGMRLPTVRRPSSCFWLSFEMKSPVQPF